MEVYTPFPLFQSFGMPFSDRKLKESVQLVGFFDYGLGRVNQTSLNEIEREEYRSAGVGLRVKLYKDMFARLEWGFPIHESDRESSDYKFHFAIQTELF